jgi:trimethylamine--corrinoid protein Co-methyltransferase
MLRHYLCGIQVDPDTLAYEVIAHVGPGGHFLGEDQTLERCRTEFWQPALFDRSGLEAWWDGERIDTTTRATQRWKELVAKHEDPALDPAVAHDLQTYVAKHLE